MKRNRVVIVTGAASGIGRASAERFLREGAKVVLADANDPSAVAAGIGAGSKAALALTVDVRHEQEIAEMIARTLEQFGRLDVLVTAAGVNRHGNALEASAEDWDWVTGVNLKGTFLCAKAAIPALREAARGHEEGAARSAIVTIGSELAWVAPAHMAAYAASKAGVVQLTRCLAVDHAADGIRANCVCPGPVQTPLLEASVRLAEDAEAHRARIVQSTILGRIGEPHEIASVIYFLASPDASFMTGSVVLADGGVTARGP